MFNNEEEQILKDMTRAINAHTHELRNLIPALSAGMVTRCDLNSTEARLTAVIQQGFTPSTEDQKILEALLARSGRVARKLEALGLSGDVDELNRQIKQLQDNPGPISPEDQAILDALQARGETIATKLEALDALTPPPAPPPV